MSRIRFFADLKVKEAETLAAEEAAEMRVSLSDREILQELADQLRPTGVIRFNAEDHLLFGERRVKAGDFLSMQYQGINYRVEVVRIDSRAFMLRLNGEVISKRIQ